MTKPIRIVKPGNILVDPDGSITLSGWSFDPSGRLPVPDWREAYAIDIFIAVAEHMESRMTKAVVARDGAMQIPVALSTEIAAECETQAVITRLRVQHEESKMEKPSKRIREREAMQAVSDVLERDGRVLFRLALIAVGAALFAAGALVTWWLM